MGRVRTKDPTSRDWGKRADVQGGYYGKGRNLTTRTVIRRIWGHGRHGKYAFQACTVLNTRVLFGGRRPPGSTIQCGTGRNPRIALAGAYRAMARAISRRRGAFAGMGG